METFLNYVYRYLGSTITTIAIVTTSFSSCRSYDITFLDVFGNCWGTPILKIAINDKNCYHLSENVLTKYRYYRIRTKSAYLIRTVGRMDIKKT